MPFEKFKNLKYVQKIKNKCSPMLKKNVVTFIRLIGWIFDLDIIQLSIQYSPTTINESVHLILQLFGVVLTNIDLVIGRRVR